MPFLDLEEHLAEAFADIRIPLNDLKVGAGYGIIRRKGTKGGKRKHIFTEGELEAIRHAKTHAQKQILAELWGVTWRTIYRKSKAAGLTTRVYKTKVRYCACGEKVHAKGLCQIHYDQAKYAANRG